MPSSTKATLKALHKLKCNICKCYLSVPPIALISKHGDKYKCGRCKDIPTEVNIRLEEFENVLKFFKFRCAYKRCKQDLPWGEAEKHEEACAHKTYQCHLERCSQTIKISEIEHHYEHKYKKHGENQLLFYNELQIKDIKSNKVNAYVCIKNSIAFLVYVSTLSSEFWICVFCLQPNSGINFRYIVKLSPGNNKHSSLVRDNQKIIPYKEREHCLKCFINKCHIKSHKIPQSTKPDFRTTQIPYEYFKKLSKSSNFTCTIDILGDFRTSIQENQTALDNLQISGSSDLVRQSLQCPICMEYMIDRIYTCNRGHAICSDCKAMVAICPQCQGDFGETRNFALENMAENVELSCQNVQRGCDFAGNLLELRKHELNCLYYAN